MSALKRLAPLYLAALLVGLAVPAGAQLAPLTDGVAWSHAPYEVGDCSICHESGDPSAPGAVSTPGNELCLACHDQIGELMATGSVVHAAADDACTTCHNPHNAARRKLLLADSPGLCLDCHDDIGETATGSAVQHDAITQGVACMNCHNPHATNVQHLLIDLPYDLCVGCHGQDGMVDESGRALTDFPALLAGSAMRHGPVEDKDCSACHETHGGANFRLLISAYPEKFYAPWDPANYDLCFTCHEADVFQQERTTTLTGFRDGDWNLHYLHVNKADRGRTCRACHEVHAAPQPHIIRDGVPYGSSGWILKINFVPEPNGGTCAKTCHSAKSYDRTRG